ncbi:MAG: hypothetical protein JW883_05880 [Deltaproteobacteria bacterium]|nr:hypothetical protein [Deltaproteobacteria bacterium]
MNITDTSDHIRQQQAGQFRRPGDGREPFIRVNDQRLESARDQKTRSVFVNNESVVSFGRGILQSAFPKLFDSDAGMKFNAERIRETEKEEKPQEQYDKDGQPQTVTSQKNIVDQWA